MRELLGDREGVVIGDLEGERKKELREPLREDEFEVDLEGEPARERMGDDFELDRAGSWRGGEEIVGEVNEDVGLGDMEEERVVEGFFVGENERVRAIFECDDWRRLIDEEDGLDVIGRVGAEAMGVRVLFFSEDLEMALERVTIFSGKG
jgi:hypothetical protein